VLLLPPFLIVRFNMSFGLTWYFLSFKGRISRQEFWLGYVGLILVLLILRRPLQEFGLHWLRPAGRDWQRDELLVAMWMPVLAAVTATLWPISAIYAKRLHDLNLSGWWMLVLPLITMIETLARIDPWNMLVLAAIATFGLLPGTPGENRFGGNPLL
jgi:uncharacterized membrane protein YhaH (DUF805 family)